MLWQVSGWIAWAVAAVIFIWLVWDFFRINAKYDENVLLSSREGIDELFASEKEGR